MMDDLDAVAIGRMPRALDLIAAEGVTLDRALATATLCNPARASFFTGRYPHTIGMRNGGHDRFHRLGLDRESLGPWLQRAGYYTAFAGKYVNDYPRGATDNFIPPGWNRWAAALYEDFYEQYDYAMNEDGRTVVYDHKTADYFTDVLTRKSLDFIADAHAKGKPLALIVAPSAPHIPTVAAPRYGTAFARDAAPRPPSFQEANTRDKPPFSRFGLMPQKRIDQIDKEYRGRLRMLAAVDDMIVAIVGALEARHMLDETYLIVTSDQGYHMGQHNMAPQKKTAYEEDIRIPVFVRGPGVPRGVHRAHIVTTTDFAPTLVALAGGTVPDDVDGRSFAALLGATPPSLSTWRHAMLVTRLPDGTMPPPPPLKPPTAEYNCVKPTSTAAIIPEYWAVRTTRYTYVEYVTGDRELYDNTRDPYQLANRYCSAPKALRDSLSSLLSALKRCSGRSCRTAENRVVD